MNTLTRRIALGAMFVLSLTLGVSATEPTTTTSNPSPAALPNGLVNLALGKRVTAKTLGNLVQLQDVLKEKIGQDACLGWSDKRGLPFLYANPAETLAEVPKFNKGVKVKSEVQLPARSIVVHPGEEADVRIAWQSPITGTVSLKMTVAHIYAGPSDGVTWSIEHENQIKRILLKEGRVGARESQTFPSQQDGDKPLTVTVTKGEVLAVNIGRNAGHQGDLTSVEITLTEVNGDKRVWNLLKDVAADIQSGNPHADSLGNAAVWHFLSPKTPLVSFDEPFASYPWSPSQLVDGVRVVGAYSSASLTTGPVVDEWVEIDLGANQNFNAVKLFPLWAHARNGAGAAGFPIDYTISVKPDAGQYTVVKTVTGQSNPGINAVLLNLGQQQARYVKIAVTKISEPPREEKTFALRLAEVEVLGPNVATPGPTQATAIQTPKPNWRLQTANTAVTIAVAENRPLFVELSSVQQQWNWIASPTPIDLPSRLSTLKNVKNLQNDKNAGLATWKFQEGTLDPTGERLTLRFTCNEAPKLEFKCIWWAVKGPGPVQYHEVIENQTGEGVALWPQRAQLNLGVQSDRQTVLWRFNKDSRNPVPKALFQDLLTDRSQCIAPIDGPNGFIPFVTLDSGSHGLYVGGEWQDGTIRIFASGNVPTATRITKSLGQEYTPVQGAQVELPMYYMGAYSGEVDDGCNEFKKWFFNTKVPENMRKDPTEPWAQWGAFWQEKYDGQWWSDEKTFVKGMKEKLSEVGFESVNIDFGWWGKQTDWTADPTKWPSGMKIAGPLANENGFKFTLYFKGKVAKETLHQKMTEYGVDTYRSDFGAPSGPEGMALLDWMSANHPKFRWENCDCGGLWKDYAAMRRATIIFGTDVYDQLTSRKMFQVSSYCIHPAQLQMPIALTALTKGQPKPSDPVTAEGVSEVRSVLQGAMFLWGFSMPSDHPAYIPVLKDNLVLYKTRLRPLIRSANLYHLFLRPDGVDWDGIQYHNPVDGKGAIMLFKPNNPFDTRRIYLKGLDRKKTYTLTFQDRPDQNTKKSGADLIDDGFDVTLTGKNVSEIIWVNE